MPGCEIFGEEERREVQDVLETGVLMRYGFDGQRLGRWKARDLESALCSRLGVRFAHLTSSGTAALSTALAALGVGEDDEVILPPFTFVASFEAVLSTGATPVFADVDDSLTLSPRAVAAAITPRTRVVMPVHMCGAMADVPALQEICTRHDLLLVEDACQALGATCLGQPVGTSGAAGVLSFDFMKTVTCGEGGAVLTRDETTYRRCEGYADHGHDHLGADRGADQHPFIGYNYRISELHAAIGLAQLRRLDLILARQRTIKRIFTQALEGHAAISFPRLPDPHGDSATFFTFFLPDRAHARSATASLMKAGLAPCYWYQNNWHYIRQWTHLLEGASLYRLSASLRRGLEKTRSGICEESDTWMGRCISISLRLSWSDEEVQRRAALLRETLDHAQ